MTFTEHRYKTFDGLTLYCREYGAANGSKTPVLCLPGLTRNSRDFHRLASRISDRRRVFALDFRGRGQSEYDPNWRNYAMETYVADIRHLLDHFSISSAMVVGTSMGGVMAMAMAEQLPDRLAGAVINDIGPEFKLTGLTKVLRYMQSDRVVNSWEAAVARMKKAFPDLPAQNEEDWLEIVQGTYRENGKGELEPDWDRSILKPLAVAILKPIDLWPLYRALGERPVVAVRGGTSGILSASVHAKMCKALPNVRGVTVAGIGHAPSLCEPECLEAIYDILDRA